MEGVRQQLLFRKNILTGVFLFLFLFFVLIFAQPGLPGDSIGPLAQVHAPGTLLDGEILYPVVQITGSREVVMDHSVEACTLWDVPDYPARALQITNAQGDEEIQLYAGNDVPFKSVGSTLDTVTRDCDHQLFTSRLDFDPSHYRDHEWIAQPYTPDGVSIFSLVHNEFYGHEHGCGDGTFNTYDECVHWVQTWTRSNDRGLSFNSNTQLFTDIPWRYDYNEASPPFRGVSLPTNFVEYGGGGRLYSLLNNIYPPEWTAGNNHRACLLEIDLSTNVWNYWTGSGFTLTPPNPYTLPSSYNPADYACEPIDPANIPGEVTSLTWNEALQKYLLIGRDNGAYPGDSHFGAYYSVSDDLIHWSPRQLLFEFPSIGNPALDGSWYLYPSLIDGTVAGQTRNFQRTGSNPYLYLTYRNPGPFRIPEDADRDLVRFPLTVRWATSSELPNVPTSMRIVTRRGSLHDIAWSDTSNDEQGFIIQRKENNGLFETIARVPANTTTYISFGLSSGNVYTYRVKAISRFGTSAWSNEAQGAIDSTLPTVSITSPVAGSTVSDSITLSATASDNLGIDRVEFFLGSNLIGQDSSQPYSVLFNTSILPDGFYNFKARAIDLAANVSGFSIAGVTVDNGPPAPPDGDNDGIPDSDDNCVAVFNPGQEDNDGDARGDVCDSDDDNDSVPDAGDNCPFTSNAGQENFDGDARGDVCDSDDDNDGVLDLIDNCPFVPNSGQENNDGDARGDVCDDDDDNDGVLDGGDNCPFVSNTDQADANGDGIGDACEGDSDGDHVPDSVDNCPNDPNPAQNDADGDGVGDLCDSDDDNDGILDTNDNCPLVENVSQQNTDGDAFGNACDSDDDNDGVLDNADNCPLTFNTDQANFDGDLEGDVCDNDDDNDGVSDSSDNCPFTVNADQRDSNGNGIGDACGGDSDGDGVGDSSDNCPFIVNPEQNDVDLDGIGDQCDGDRDGDGFENASDNCPSDSNPGQEDGDNDGIGDVCDSSFDARGGGDGFSGAFVVDRVDVDGFPVAETSVLLDGRFPTEINPASFSVLEDGSHLVSVTDLPNYGEEIGSCSYAENEQVCLINTYTITPICDGTFCKFTMEAFNGRTVRLLVRYTFGAGDTSDNEGHQSRSVLSFTLINSRTNEHIPGYNPLPDGAVLNLAHLPTRLINIRANVSDSVSSVRFSFNAIEGHRLDSTRPFALHGDLAGDYFGWTPPLGQHIVVATPFPILRDEAGNNGSRTLTFFVIDDPDAEPLGPIPSGPSPSSSMQLIPNAPFDLQANAVSDGQVRLTWHDNSDNEEGFDIQQRVLDHDFVSIGDTSSDVIEYLVGGLEPETFYSYRIRAFNADGISTFSPDAHATTPAAHTFVTDSPVLPGTPSSLSGSFSQGVVTLTWVDQAGDEQGFIIERGIRGDSFKELARIGSNIQRFEDSPQSSQTYYYQVKAYNRGGESSYSNIARVSVPASDVPLCLEGLITAVCECGSEFIDAGYCCSGRAQSASCQACVPNISCSNWSGDVCGLRTCRDINNCSDGNDFIERKQCTTSLTTSQGQSSSGEDILQPAFGKPPLFLGVELTVYRVAFSLVLGVVGYFIIKSVLF